MDNQRLKGQGTVYLKKKKKRKKLTESSRQTLFTTTPLHYSDKIMTQSNLLHFDHPTAIKKEKSYTYSIHYAGQRSDLVFLTKNWVKKK